MTRVSFVQRWERGYQLLAAFRAEHGHLRVPVGYRVGGINLYSWVNDQRQAHRHRKLPAERVRRLTALGVDWHPQARIVSMRPDLWERSYAVAERFYQRHGHLHPEPGHTEGGVRLHLWLIGQLIAYRQGRLSAHRIAQLEAIGIEWRPARSSAAAGRDPPRTGAGPGIPSLLIP